MPKFNHSFDIYRDVFLPPEGYQTDFAELTTYSLSRHFLTAIPAMLYAGDRGLQAPGAQKLTKLLRDDAFLKGGYSHKFHVFYDGNAKTTADSEDFCRKQLDRYATFLECGSCTPVKLDKGGLFHPKLILLQFSKKRDETAGEKPVEGPDVKFRLVVSSRNLTWANYFEAGVILEGEPGDKNSQVGEALCEFLRKYYQEYENIDPPDDHIRWDLLQKTAFRVTIPGDTDGEVEPSSVELFFGRDETTLLARINDEAANQGYNTCNAISMNPTDKLFINALHVEYICNFKDMYALNGKGDAWDLKTSAKQGFHFIRANKDGSKPLLPVPIHAKVYLLWNSADNSKYSVWVGSANCSMGGLGGKNEEALLHMTFIKANPDLPTVNIQGNGLFKTVGTGGTYKIASVKDSYKVNEVQITDCENEFPSLNYQISGVKCTADGKTVIVDFTYENQEAEPVLVLYRGKSQDGILIEPGQEKNLSERFPISMFTNIVRVKKGTQTFEVRLNITYKGAPEAELLKNLPPEIPERVADLIPLPPEHANAADGAYERLCKHQFFSPDYRQILEVIRDDIDELQKHKQLLTNLYCSTSGNVFDSDFWEDWGNIDFLEKHGMNVLLHWVNNALGGTENGKP